MSVKRYSLNLSANRSVELNESLHGSLVKYHDYAALEARCAAMAAEVQSVKASIPKPKDIEFENDNMDDVSLAEDVGFNDAVTLMNKWMPKTPDTDAFLAEVRAQGVEMMAAEADQLMDEFGDDSYKVMVTADLQLFANAFAAQLRKGVKP